MPSRGAGVGAQMRVFRLPGVCRTGVAGVNLLQKKDEDEMFRGATQRTNSKGEWPAQAAVNGGVWVGQGIPKTSSGSTP
jgi:hypothetical protein